jgi:hypothetical protein
MRITKLIKPTILSTNVPASPNPAYDSGTTYAIGAVVWYETNGLIHEYESVSADNLGNEPTDTTHWLDLGVVNQHRMFDYGASTVTEHSSNIVVEMTPQARFDRVAVAGISGVSNVSVKYELGDTVLVSHSSSTKDTGLGTVSASFYEWFFGDKDRYVSKAGFDMNTVNTTGKITVTLTKNPTADVASCASVVVGRSRIIGATLDGVSVSREDYSTVETDVFGKTRFVKRQSAKRVSCNIILDSANVDSVNNALADIGGEPALFDMNEPDTDYSSLLLLGFYEDFSINLTFNKSHCTLSVLEVL